MYFDVTDIKLSRTMNFYIRIGINNYEIVKV